ncbi:MAG: class I SAM-dependent methyltransferase [Chloroflexi bacterium]|nr:class I SAM-dependent methyltransferase [Chloroflexota bacterium]
MSASFVPASQIRDQNIALRRALKELTYRQGRMLEGGCGAGRFLQAIRCHRPDLEGYGCDLSRRAIALAKQGDAQINYALADIGKLPYAEAQFDVVLVFDVLEHLPEPAQAIKEINRVLKPGGMLHALVPCEGQPLTLHWLMSRLKLAADLKKRHLGHIQRFSHRHLWELLSGHGLNIKRYTYSMHPFGQMKDIIAYLKLEEWARYWHLARPFSLLQGLLWGPTYIESRLLASVPFSAVAVHVTAEKPI